MNENKIWLNQQLMYYKDFQFQTNSVFEVSLSSSTQDFKNFSPPCLNISITSNNLRRNHLLNYQNSVDLLISIKDIFSNVDYIYEHNRDNSIVKKYQGDRTIKIEFKEVSSTKERIVIFSIIHSNTDFAKIIFPLSIFSSFSNGLLKSFCNDYIKIMMDLINRTLMSELLDQLKLVRNGIQVLPTMIKNNPENVLDIFKTEEPEEIEVTSNQINDLDKFLKENESEIDIGIDKIQEEKKEKPQEIKSLFISKFLKGKISNFEDLVNSLSISQNPIQDFFMTYTTNVKNIDFDTFIGGELKEEEYHSLI